MVYHADMNANTPIDLAALREEAGLTARELARQLNVHHSTVLKWEELGKVAKSEYIAPLAEILGVTVEELLCVPKQRSCAPAGRADRIFEEVSRLPRSRQKMILDVVDALLKDSDPY
jgi:transcriptional regulator with XRE-family HTH domain